MAFPPPPEPFKAYRLGPAKPELRPRRPDDPAEFDPIAPGTAHPYLCFGCWFYENDRGRECPGSGNCNGERRPDGRKVIFVPKIAYGNEED